ncbi:MAG: flagellar basal body P-ring protein FlgI [Verrucomicrobiales bacterium]|nr:flagellar basal body P-ring protein FlgI [Verrucomicrobiales bacterium]
MALGCTTMVQAQQPPLAGAVQNNGVRVNNTGRINSDLNVQVRDLCFVLGARDNQLVGYGIVSGLAGDGDKDPEYTLQAVANMLERFGLTLPPSALTSKNIAAVVLTADIPPFVRSGSRIDVHVAAMGDARSLHGAVLARTPLLGPDGTVYAVAQGPVAVGGFIGGIPGPGGASVQKNHPTSGQIVRGAVVEREIPVTFVKEKKLELIMRQPDFVNATAVADKINEFVMNDEELIDKVISPALARNGSTIQVKIPEDFTADPVRFLARIEQLSVTVNTPARVVLNERTGTIVATSRVAVSSCAVAHGNIIVNIAQGYDISQPQVPLAGGAPVLSPATDIVINEGEGMLTPFRSMPTVQDVAKSLNALGVTPRDMMAIFQAMKQAGALQAELILR